MIAKKNYLPKLLWFNCLALLLTGAPLKTAETKPDDGAKNSLGKDVIVTAGKIKFPGLTIDRDTHEVRMDATVCLDSGILEYVVCKTGTFEHESIFVTDVEPEILHTALLLTGFEPTPMPPGFEEIWWSRALGAEASRVRIEVEWEVDGIVERANITSMIRRNTGSDEEMTYYDAPGLQEEELEEVSDAWVFLGSIVGMHENGQRLYAANYTGVIVGIWANPTAVIQYGKKTRNPYRGTNQGMAVNADLVPELDTDVTLIFSKYDPTKNDSLDE